MCGQSSSPVLLRRAFNESKNDIPIFVPKAHSGVTLALDVDDDNNTTRRPRSRLSAPLDGVVTDVKSQYQQCKKKERESTRCIARVASWRLHRGAVVADLPTAFDGRSRSPGDRSSRCENWTQSIASPHAQGVAQPRQALRWTLQRVEGRKIRTLEDEAVHTLCDGTRV